MASRYPISTILDKLKSVHGDTVQLDVSTFSSMNEKARFIHSVLGEWWATPTKVIVCKHNHPGARKTTIEEVKRRLAETHGGRVTIDESTFISVSKKATFIDAEYGRWEADTIKVAFYGAFHPKRSMDRHIKHMKNLMETTDTRDKVRKGVAAVADKIKKTNIERYGVDNIFKTPNFHKTHGTNNKTEEEKLKTRLARYERHRLRRAEKRKGMVRKPWTNTPLNIQGVSLKSLWNKHYSTKISYSYLCKRVNVFRPKTQKELEDLVTSMCNGSDIENLASKLLNVPLHNRFVDGTNAKPDFKLSDALYVNVDGLYWHSDKMTDRQYHFKLRESFEKKGLRLLQFRADEIMFKPSIVASIVNAKMGISKRVYARKTKIVNVETSTAMKFLNDNHLMGSCGATTYVGLEGSDGLVAMAALSIKDNKCKVVRFCSLLGHTVVGGYSKILEYAKNLYHLDEIISFVDLRYGSTSSLIGMGFELRGITLGWKWTDYTNTFNRLRCRANMDSRKLSEKEYAKELKLVKIYDAGQAKMVWKK